jgi:hypothetical protein
MSVRLTVNADVLGVGPASSLISNSKIAQALHISEAAVKSRLRHARSAWILGTFRQKFAMGCKLSEQFESMTRVYLMSSWESDCVDDGSALQCRLGPAACMKRAAGTPSDEGIDRYLRLMVGTLFLWPNQHISLAIQAAGDW